MGENERVNGEARLIEERQKGESKAYAAEAKQKAAEEEMEALRAERSVLQDLFHEQQVVCIRKETELAEEKEARAGEELRLKAEIEKGEREVEKGTLLTEELEKAKEKLIESLEEQETKHRSEVS